MTTCEKYKINGKPCAHKAVDWVPDLKTGQRVRLCEHCWQAFGDVIARRNERIRERKRKVYRQAYA